MPTNIEGTPHALSHLYFSIALSERIGLNPSHGYTHVPPILNAARLLMTIPIVW